MWVPQPTWKSPPFIPMMKIPRQDFPDMRVGPEPTTDKYFSFVSPCHLFHNCCRFIIVCQGSSSAVVPGHALVMDSEKQFAPLAKFGSSFLNRYRGEQKVHIYLSQTSMIHFLPQIAIVNLSFPCFVGHFSCRHSWDPQVFEISIFLICFLVVRNSGGTAGMTSLVSSSGLPRESTASFSSLTRTSSTSATSYVGPSKHSAGGYY